MGNQQKRKRHQSRQFGKRRRLQSQLFGNLIMTRRQSITRIMKKRMRMENCRILVSACSICISNVRVSFKLDQMLVVIVNLVVAKVIDVLLKREIGLESIIAHLNVLEHLEEHLELVTNFFLFFE